LPHIIAPWNTTAWVGALAPGLSAEPRVEDIFRGRNPGPFQDEDPTSVNYNLDAQPPIQRTIYGPIYLSTNPCDYLSAANGRPECELAVLRGPCSRH
jgi:hypothetical protein